MELIPKNIRYVNGAFWLIKLRWIAIAWVLFATFIAYFGFHLSIEIIPFILVSLFLTVENILSLHILKKLSVRKDLADIVSITTIIRLQISLDLICLTFILHYSGGIENPLFMFSVFHMVVTSILLTKRDSYLQTTFALLLLWGLGFLEYFGIFSHTCLWLERSVAFPLYKDLFYLVETLTIFTITSYILVYIANYIVGLLRKQETAYQEANNMLQEKDKIKDEYILRVTHNIKGHITAILTNLAIVADKTFGQVDDRNAEFIETAYGRTSKLTSFVNTLLKLTQMRLEDKFEFEAFSLNEVIRNSVSSVQPNLDAKSIKLTIDIDERASLITANLISIEELFLNLLNNAIKYTPEKGKIDIQVKNYKDDVLITIADSGIGIPLEEQPSIFNEFYRASNAKKLIRDGSGLGLAMSKYITDRHGGDIWVTSEEGVGSKFSVVLPKNQAATQTIIENKPDRK